MTQLLRDVIHVLTRPHLRRTTNTEGETIYGEEPALLDILEDCVASTTGSKAGGGGGRGTPVDLGALDLAAEIKRTTQEHWPVQGVLKAPLRLRVNAWYANTHEPNEALRMYETVFRWESQIREMIEPTKKVAMRGVTCTQCQCTHVEKPGEDGVTYSPAITVYPDAVPVYATCGVCAHEWSGKEIHELAAQGVAPVNRNV